MTTDQVKALSPVDRFLYWCEERHRIYLRRQNGDQKPWTEDSILQRFYFTNTYRELDKTTTWFREEVRDPLRDTLDVIMATVIFRWFNYIPTGELLLHPTPGEKPLLTAWDPARALKLLGHLRSNGQQIFTGAFMINSPAGEPKLEAIIRRIDNVWKDRERLEAKAGGWTSLQQAHKDFTQYEGLGGFMAYELVCDLRFTKWLSHATDINWWANPGPGAIRGMYRVLGREIKNKSNATAPSVPKEWDSQIMNLRLLLQEHMHHHFGEHIPAIEAREVEMSLCEYDKYVRLLLGEGKSKRTYKGV